MDYYDFPQNSGGSVLVSMANLAFARKSIAYLYAIASLLSFGVNALIFAINLVFFLVFIS